MITCLSRTYKRIVKSFFLSFALFNQLIYAFILLFIFHQNYVCNTNQICCKNSDVISNKVHLVRSFTITCKKLINNIYFLKQIGGLGLQLKFDRIIEKENVVAPRTCWI